MKMYEVKNIHTGELVGHIEAEDEVQACIEAAEQQGGDPIDYEAEAI